MRIQNSRAWRRNKLKSKYIRNLKRNMYWLVLDKETDFREPKSWKDLDEHCKFAKKLRSGGNPTTFFKCEKLYMQELANNKKGYPKIKEKEDIIDINETMDNLNDPMGERFCQACIFFGKEDCPFLNKVNEETQWKEIGCKKFFD